MCKRLCLGISNLHSQHTTQTATFVQQVESVVDVSQVHVVGNVLVHLNFLQTPQILVERRTKISSNT
jgi:hypothetical protein